MPIDYNRYHEHGRTRVFGDVFERCRVRHVAAVLKRYPPARATRAMLDIGSGEGRYLPVWHALLPQAQIYALEYSALAVSRAAESHPFAEHIVGSGDELPLRSGTVDAVVSIEVIEHVERARQMLSEVRRVLRPGGWALISTPCGNAGSLEWWQNFVRGKVVRGVDDGVLFGWSEDPTHLRRYRSPEFRQICDSLGLATTRVFFRVHGLETVCSRIEHKVKGRINLERRSLALARGFENLLDGMSSMDWHLFKHMPFGSSMIALLQRSPGVTR